MTTQNDLKNMPDSKLLEWVKNAKGHTGSDFKEVFGTDFGYGVLTNELKSRGYVNGWYKEGAMVVTEKSTEFIYLEDLTEHGQTVKTSFDIGKETLERWRKTISPIAHKSRILEIALLRFLDALDSGELDFKMKR